MSGDCVCRHAEAAAQFGATALDPTSSVRFAAVAIEGPHAGESDEVIAPDDSDLRQVG